MENMFSSRIRPLILLMVIIISTLDAFQYRSLLDSYRLAQRLGQSHKIDDSHNHRHSKEVLFWACAILRGEASFSERELLMIGNCCLLHDLIDHKYTNCTDDVASHLRLYHPDYEVERMLLIMNSMSYSKIVSPDGMVDMPLEHDRVFHVVREADLLSSYNIARMVEYRLHNFDMSDDEIRKDVCHLYRNRMATLVDMDLFATRSGRQIARSLDLLGRLRLPLLKNIDLHGNLDLLRVVNYLSIHDLIDTLFSLYRCNDIIM